MNRYQRVQQILDDSIGGPTAQIGVHGAFWRGKTRDQFTVLIVRNRPLLIVGDGAGSNLVKSLKGEAPFGADLENPPVGATLSRMPAGFDPVSAADIAFIEQWINEGCLEDPFDPAAQDTELKNTAVKNTAAPLTAAHGLQWRPTNAPLASSRTDDIWFVDSQVGWAVNSNGSILHTTDGFDTYDVQFQDLPAPGGDPIYFRCLAFAGPTRGWAGTLTAGKTLFETTNGHTWSQVTNLPALAPSAICGMHAVSPQVIFAAGTNYPNRPPRMMKSLDGGASWTAWNMKPWADLLIDCFFISPLRGWVVGGKTDQPIPTRANVKPVVLLTEDGGQTWTNRVADIQAQFPLGEWGWKIQFLNDNIGFVSLENFHAGAILKTTDGGHSWTRLPINDPQQNANLEGVGFVDEQHGWVGGWGDENFESQSSSETLDGGLTWRNANEIGRGINRFRFFADPVTVGYASGQTVYQYSDAPLPKTRAAVATQPPPLFNWNAPGRGLPIEFTLFVKPRANRLALYLWDRFGEFITTVVDEPDPAAGTRTLTWNGQDATGKQCAPGHFIARAVVDDTIESRVFNWR